jgi:hypothetical protein
MSVYNEGAAMTRAVKGVLVESPDAALPQSAQVAKFTVVGKCEITSFGGKVGTVIETQANNTKIVSNPTVGTDYDMCAVLDISADEASSLYSISGTATDAMVGGTHGVAGMLRSVIIDDGTIDVSCAASNTGTASWFLTYVPLEDGASIVAI